MKEEMISDHQAISLMVLFIGGSALLFGIGGEAKQDAWLAILLSILFAFPVLIIYAKLHSLFPHKNLFDIFELVLGKLLGKTLCLLYVWFSIHLGTLVLNDFGEFPTIISISETPKMIPMICIIFLCTWAIKEGITLLGRWAQLSILGVICSVVIGTLLLIPEFNINRIYPILSHGILPIMKGAFGIFSFPFAETIVFCFVFSKFKHKKSPYKIYSIGLIIGSILIFTVSLTNLLTLGVPSYTSLFFPSYASVSRIMIGDFLQRIEVIVSISFFLGGFVKISICLLAACKGITKIFNMKDYRFIVTPIALFMLNLSDFLHKNMIDVSLWTNAIWRYYAFPFQVIFPIMILILALIKKKYGML
ncbi:GerAB/ArcD/ProY family transporter [Inediibacterium massiliense]|uniref:GerAB/ArcD/ProY family transporter n=1 Tax=Inediibacterium massiliense TaxID=1658111 RepID=UPI0006B517D6|nr:endospore germination permease [Inediibacterium massiliense]